MQVHIATAHVCRLQCEGDSRPPRSQFSPSTTEPRDQTQVCRLVWQAPSLLSHLRAQECINALFYCDVNCMSPGDSSPTDSRG